MITDGTTAHGAQPTAFVLFQSNEVVATAGTGVGIAAGHDVSATANRIVSCGVTSAGSSYAWGANAIVIWNYYASSQFYNNTISGTVGGMVGPGTNSKPTAFDVWANPPDMLNPGNSVSGNDFTDPCLVGGTVNLQAEDAERTFWTAKIDSCSRVTLCPCLEYDRVCSNLRSEDCLDRLTGVPLARDRHMSALTSCQVRSVEQSGDDRELSNTLARTWSKLTGDIGSKTFPSGNNSGAQPAYFEHNTGSPAHIASFTTRPQLSSSVGKTKTSAE
jgi:hypothetical protein